MFDNCKKLFVDFESVDEILFELFIEIGDLDSTFDGFAT